MLLWRYSRTIDCERRKSMTTSNMNVPWQIRNLAVWDARGKPLAALGRNVRLEDAVLMTAAPELRQALIDCLEALDAAGQSASSAARSARQLLDHYGLW
jgi:hypothetical protein